MFVVYSAACPWYGRIDARYEYDRTDLWLGVANHHLSSRCNDSMLYMHTVRSRWNTADRRTGKSDFLRSSPLYFALSIQRWATSYLNSLAGPTKLHLLIAFAKMVINLRGEVRCVLGIRPFVTNVDITVSRQCIGWPARGLFIRLA